MAHSDEVRACALLSRGALQAGNEQSLQRDGDERVAAFAPGVQAAFQRPNALDAFLPEEQRHTGAGGFVWSSAVEDDFAVTRQTVVLLFQLLGVHGMAQVNDYQFFAGVDFFLQFIHGNT
jgi:hypothetical protein